MLAGSATTPELIWTVMGAVAFVVAGLNVLDAIHDKRAVRRSGKNGILKMLASYAVLQEWVRLWKAACVLTLGVYSSLNYPPFHRHPPISAGVVILSVALFGIAIGIVVGSMLAAFARHRVVDELERREKVAPLRRSTGPPAATEEA